MTIPLSLSFWIITKSLLLPSTRDRFQQKSWHSKGISAFCRMKLWDSCRQSWLQQCRASEQDILTVDSYHVPVKTGTSRTHHRAYRRGDVFAQTACTHRGQLQTQWTGLWDAGSDFCRSIGSCAIHKSLEIILAAIVILSMLGISLGVHIRWKRSKSLICISASEHAEALLHELAEFKQGHAICMAKCLAKLACRAASAFLLQAKL